MYVQTARLGFSILFLLSLLALSAQNAGNINFIDNDIKEAIRQAEEENKLIFIDGYATWCVPCKLMEDEVFIHQNVYEYFNDHFINLKLDLEEGIGPMLSARYDAHTLPFYMFLSNDETLVHSMHGFQRIHELLREAKRAQQPERLRSAWDKRYKEGDRKPSFLYNYAFAIYPSPDDLHRKVVDEYLESSPDMTTPQNVRFVFHFVEDVDSDLFRHLIENQRYFSDELGEEKVQASIDMMVDNAVLNSSPELSVEQVSDLYIMAYPSSGEKKALEYKMIKYDKVTEAELYTQTLLKYYDLVPPSDAELHETSRYIMQSSQSEIQFDLIAKWLNRLSEQTNHPEYLVTKAELQAQRGDVSGALLSYKLGKKRAKQAKDKDQVRVFQQKYKSLKKTG